MTLNLENAGTVLSILVGLFAFLAGMFAVLRYIIRAETSELRTNDGSTLKDAVNRIETMATDTNTKLQAHVKESKELIAKGAETERELREAFSNVAKALPIVAASKPPAED